LLPQLSLINPLIRNIFIMGWFSDIVVILIGAWTILYVSANGVGPALEAPAALNIFARAAYYIFHRRFRDWFVPSLSFGLVDRGLDFLRGKRSPFPLWVDCLSSLLIAWLFSFTMTRMEASQYRNQPWSSEEIRLWTEGMTRREFLQRARV